MPSHSEQDSDVGLVQGMVRRDMVSFSSFYDIHAPTVFAFLCKMFSDPTEAEDIVQDAFWQIWKEASQYDPSRGRPIAWLIQIARSRGIDRLRQLRLKAQRDGGHLEEWHEQIQTQPTAEEKITVQETDSAIHHEVDKYEMDKLPQEQREAITLAFFGGLTHHEISKRLVTPLGTIKTRIRLGMQKLYEGFGGNHARD